MRSFAVVSGTIGFGASTWRLSKELEKMAAGPEMKQVAQEFMKEEAQEINRPGT